MKSKRYHAIVHGRVQGVFFRDYTKQQAEQLDLNGWVRNLADRTVEVVFEGESDKVAAMMKWLKTGSPLSAVTSVELTEEEPRGEIGFLIRY